MAIEERKDSLTGCYLRESLDLLLRQLITDSNKNKRVFSVALIDLDHFKKFNDKFGHLFGDEVLKYTASVLGLTFYMDPYHLFRYGGDEFVAVFPDVEPGEAFHLLRHCVHNMKHRQFLFKNRLYKIAISTGISGYPYDGGTPEELIQKADQAMYYSKRHSCNLVTLAGKIRYLRWRNFIVITTSIFIIAWSAFVLYQLKLKKIIAPSLAQIKNIKIITRPRNLDAIILKDGTIFEGRILEETKDKVILSLYLQKGEGRSTFDRSDIERIERRTK